jgi:hypothetical protein
MFSIIWILYLPRGAVLAVCFPDKMAEGNALDEKENINFDGCSVVNVKSNFKSFNKGEGIRIHVFSHFIFFFSLSCLSLILISERMFSIIWILYPLTFSFSVNGFILL